MRKGEPNALGAIESIAHGPEAIASGIKSVADWINARIDPGERYVAIVALKGALPFAGHLMPLLKGEIEWEFVSVSSYPSGTKRRRAPRFSGLGFGVEGKNAIVIDDVADGCGTLRSLIAELKAGKAKSILVATLFFRKSAPLSGLGAETFSPLELPDGWAVGFGMDFRQRWRNLPFVGILKKRSRDG